MNVGLVIYGSLETLTGGYIYDKHLVDHLGSRGHRVKVIHLPCGPYAHRLTLNFSREILERLAEPVFDILLEDELCHPSLFLLNRRLRKRVFYPVGTIIHHLLSSEPRNAFGNFFFGVVEKWYLQSVQALIFNSETTRENVSKRIQGRRPSIIAHPAGDGMGAGPSLSQLKERSFRPGPLHLLFLGSVIARKGLLPLLECLEKVPHELWRLSVVGDLETEPSYVNRVRNFIQEKGLEESIRLLGQLERTEVAEVLMESQVLCMPFAYEGFGIATLEGMGFGLPALGSTAGAAGEIIQAGRNGFLIRPFEGALVREVILRFHEDRGRLYQMSEAALKVFESRPTWDESMERIVEFLIQLTRRRA